MNMDTKHTLGPWWFAKTAFTGLGLNHLYAVGAGDKEHAQVSNRENARLIAAAPDLLAALDRIVQLNDKLPIEHPSRLSHGEYEQACAAIARAKGEA